MTDKPKLIPVADITVKTGEYEKDGKKRNRYKNIGTLFARSDEGAESFRGHSFTIKLDALPNQGEGWLSLFERETKGATDNVAEVNEDDPINLDNIPF